jgi:translation initiation factor IF-1
MRCKTCDSKLSWGSWELLEGLENTTEISGKMIRIRIEIRVGDFTTSKLPEELVIVELGC